MVVPPTSGTSMVVWERRQEEDGSVCAAAPFGVRVVTQDMNPIPRGPLFRL